MNKLFYYACSVLLASSAMFTVSSCADKDLDDNNGAEGKDVPVSFTVNDIQEGVISRGAMTRGAITPGLTASDLAGGKLNATNNNELCLIETTVEGINPIKADARTRANIVDLSTLSDFSSSGVRGTEASNMLANGEWFHLAKTKKSGELYTPIFWAYTERFARFYAVSPEKDQYSKMTISAIDATSGRPNVEFEIETDVKKQVDLMTACTGDVEYKTQGVHPTTKLDFRHALTAIRFAVGQNLPWGKTIDRVELRNILLKGKYNLPTKADGSDGEWIHDGYTQRGNAVLEDVSVNASEKPNTIIMGKNDDNYIFYMIPQDLTGNNVIANISFTDGSAITVPLKGRWNAGTTRTYKLSMRNSDWEYTLTSKDPSRAAKFDEPNSQPYTVTSYREDPTTHVKQAVAWKVVGYDANNDNKYSMSEKPEWLNSLSSETGNGSDAGVEEAGTASFLNNAIIDLREKRNNLLRNSPEKGSAGSPYDLSTKGGAATQRNTANCYLVSSPGHYRIPLVYGNAIKDGQKNESSYKSKIKRYNQYTKILENFKDHMGADITDPWIEKTNSGANAGINGAYLVWADNIDLFDNFNAQGALTVKNVDGDKYLDFVVKKEHLVSGCAVLAVKKDETTVWSWNIWFAPEDALSTIEVTNHEKKKFNLTKESLGWNPIVWEGTSYDTPRTVKVKVEQEASNKGTTLSTVITITQNPGNAKLFGSTTLYQFGRKDAFPGFHALKDDKTYGGVTIEGPKGLYYSINRNNEMSFQNSIQNPGVVYLKNNGGKYTSWQEQYNQYNLWSANAYPGAVTQYDKSPVVKTVYDPCPAGFHMTEIDAFTGFTTTGKRTESWSEWNAKDANKESIIQNFGVNFWTDETKTNTIFFPIAPFMSEDNVMVHHQASYYTVGRWYGNNSTTRTFEFYQDYSIIKPDYGLNTPSACSIRPSADN